MLLQKINADFVKPVEHSKPLGLALMDGIGVELGKPGWVTNLTGWHIKFQSVHFAY